MLIGLLSDTHVPETGRCLPEEVTKAFKGVDLILHAGDIYIPSVLDELEKIAPVLAALGDDDMLEDPRVKPSQVVSADGLKVGLIHSYTQRRLYSGLGEKSQSFFGGAVDVIVHGHTHIPSVSRVEGVLVVCPGSPVLPYYRFQLGSVALLEIGQGRAEVQILELK